jgi:3-oxoacyl-[acyl-carrier protein] reductase
MSSTGEIQIDRPQSVPDRPGGSGKRLQGRVAIVTGAATGIGKAIAARLAADGAAVGINHLHTPERADDVVEAISASGGSAIAVDADISQRHQFATLFKETSSAFGHVDILVNNAAVAPIKPLADVTETDIDQVLAVNVKGTLFGCQLAIEHLSDGGRIINISSSTTGLMLPGYCIYDMTKGAIEQVTRILSKELGPREITVNAVCPGATETETYRDGKSPEFLASLERMSAFNRLGQVEEIADVVAFVASDEARWITGQCIRANGGTV